MRYDFEGELDNMKRGADEMERNGWHESARLVRAAHTDCQAVYEAIKPLIRDR